MANKLGLAIILIAFGLRMYELGHDSFWNDEAGQALAAIQPTIGGMLAISRAHAMAMPLDYFVSRFTSTLGTMETLMRFPSVIWGTLSLATHFALSKKLLQPKVALLTTWLLCLTAYHIQYSQEMRFYAALSFFYLLSTLLLCKAIDQSSKFDWMMFVLVASIGLYFHPYVLLAIINGFLYLAVKQPLIQLNLKKLAPLMTSTLILGAIFLPGYLYFGAEQTFSYPLFQWGGTPFQIVVTGFGWRAVPYAEASPQFGIWELLNVGFTGIGLIISSLNFRRYKVLISLIISIFIQVGLIILADWMKGYWFFARQLFHLMPVMMIVTAVGILGLVEYVSKPLKSAKVKQGLFVGTMIVLGVLALPRLISYYHYPKSNGQQIAMELSQPRYQNKHIFVIPGYEEKIYRFYFLQANSTPDLIQQLKPTNWEALQTDTAEISDSVYLVAPALLPENAASQLETLGFTPILQPEVRWYGARMILVKE